MGFPHSSVSKESAGNAGDPGLRIPGFGRSAGEGIGYPLQYSWASLVYQLVKNPPAMWETWVWSLGWEDSLGEEKGYPLQYSSLENSMDSIVHRVAKSWTRLRDLKKKKIYIYIYIHTHTHTKYYRVYFTTHTHTQQYKTHYCGRQGVLLRSLAVGSRTWDGSSCRPPDPPPQFTPSSCFPWVTPSQWLSTRWI